MTRQPHVCVVSTSTAFGGAEAYLARLVGGLANDYAFSAVVPAHADPETVSLLAAAGATVSRVNGLRRLPSPSGVVATLRALGRVGPDLVHLNLTDQRDGAAPLLAARLRRLPVIATLNLVLPTARGVRESFSQFTLRRATAVIAVSRSVGQYLHERGIEPRIVRQGLAPPELAADARKSLGLQADDLVVGGVGRLHDQKGWDVLCSAAVRVRQARPEVRFTVVGGGPEELALRSADACKHVDFVGYRPDASGLVGAFDVLAVPSRYEAFGLVALEAMLSGVPVVAARSGGLEEVVADAGRLVPSEDAERLADALLELLGDESARKALAVRGRERARAEFGLPRMLSETSAIYQEFCA